MKTATEKKDLEKTQENQEFKKPENEQLTIEQLKVELEKKEQKIKELIETARRVQADFENYKKMSEKRNSEFVARASKDIMKRLLPVLDSLELAVKNGSDREKLLKGVELVYAQLYSALEEEGLEKINALNTKFDPYKEEALLTEQTQNEAEDDMVCEELQKGYLLNNAVLRTSKVRIKKFTGQKEGQK